MALHHFTQLAGNTPLIQIEKKVFAKFETYNPSGSIKDRMVTYIVEKALKDEIFHQNTVFLEASSGNTGVSLSMLGARLGKKVKIIMPHNMSEERKQLMKFFGADIIDVGANDFKGAIELRNQMLTKNINFWSPLQFSNPLNIECHRKTTGPEIYSDTYFLEDIGAFVHGSGTGGTMMGVWQYFNHDIVSNSRTKNMKFVLTSPWEPSDTHGIQGINDGANFLLDKNKIDQEIKIKTGDAIEYMQKLGRDKGLMVGISSAANVLASMKWLQENPDEGNVITMLCDRGERYMSGLL